jgi:hypothetical protein
MPVHGFPLKLSRSRQIFSVKRGHAFPQYADMHPEMSDSRLAIRRISGIQLIAAIDHL